ncbi:hypothetical protein JD844_012121, partial [Phrynosoma platyrhinos]
MNMVPQYQGFIIGTVFKASAPLRTKACQYRGLLVRHKLRDLNTETSTDDDTDSDESNVDINSDDITNDTNVGINSDNSDDDTDIDDIDVDIDSDDTDNYTDVDINVDDIGRDYIDNDTDIDIDKVNTKDNSDADVDIDTDTGVDAAADDIDAVTSTNITNAYSASGMCGSTQQPCLASSVGGFEICPLEVEVSSKTYMSLVQLCKTRLTARKVGLYGQRRIMTSSARYKRYDGNQVLF